MNFNFNETAGKSQSNEKKQLEGNKIHEVIFDGCEIKDLQSKDQSQTYKVLNINFHNDEGVFTHTVWEPKEADMQDTDGMYGKQPSNVKSMMLTFKHLIDAVNPSLGTLIDNGVKTLDAPNWDSLRKLMVEVTSHGIGTKTKIKLEKRKNGESAFPGFVANYSRTGQLYMRTNFIGNNIFFTVKELNKIKQQETAKPTPVNDLSFDLNDNKPSEEKLNDDFSINLADL